MIEGTEGEREKQMFRMFKKRKARKAFSESKALQSTIIDMAFAIGEIIGALIAENEILADEIKELKEKSESKE